MKKEYLKKLKDILKDMEDQKSIVADTTEKVQNKIDEFLEKIGGVQEEMQVEYDDMSEKVQEGEKGEELNTTIEAIGEVVDELTSLKDEIDDDPFEETLDKLKSIDGLGD
jgi:methyl-accepting chemotaxis protein